MLDQQSYPQFHTLFGAYLNQDSDYWGDTLEEVVSCFKRDSSHGEIEDTLSEISKFKNEAGKNLDEVFYALYGHDFNPKLWGYTTASLLEELKGLLAG